MPEATKERILDAAEDLFAEQGFAGASLRAVTRTAGVNLAAVNYHFGSKEALFHAVVARCVAPVNQERLKRLEQLEASVAHESPGVEQILNTFVAPALEGVELSPAGRRIAGRLHAEPASLVRPILEREFGALLRRYVDALHRALPQAEPPQLAWRMHFVVGAMLHTLSAPERAGALFGPEPDNLLEELVRFCAAGMSTC